MKMEYIPAEKQQSSFWSGGITTELYIYPPDCEYERRNFRFRLSTASCREEKSVFTKIENTDRILMVLSGKIRLKHGNEKSITIKPGEQDAFPGEIETKCVGTCTDYNLMMRERTTGMITYVRLSAGVKKRIETKANFAAVYFVEGTGSVFADGQKQKMKEKDFCMAREKKTENVLEVAAYTDSIVVVSEINTVL